MRLVTLPIAILVFLSCAAQQKEIDSIKSVLPNQESLDRVKSLNELSWYYKNFDLDSSIILAREALHIGNEEGAKNGIAQSLSSLANAYEAKGLLDSALDFHKQSYSLRVELNDSISMASSLNNQGIVYDELGNYSKSLDCYFQSLKIYESKSDQPYDVAMVLGNIGIVYKKQKEYDQVLEYYERALTIYSDVGSLFGQTVTKGNMGGVLLLLRRYRDAISYSQEALEGYEQQGYTRYVPYMIGNIGLAYDSLGEIQKARKLYLQAEKLHKEHDNTYELANTLIALSSNYRKNREFGRGEEAAQKALSYAEAIDAMEFQSNALLELSKNLSSSGNYRDALSALNKHLSLQDSLFEESKTKQIFELRTQYETSRKEQQIELQEAQLGLQQSQLATQQSEILRNQLLFYFSATAIVMLLVIVLLWRNRLKKKQQIELQQQRLLSKEAEINATISSQEMERARYARDLHDGFGQMISILNMNLKSLEDQPKPVERQKIFDASTGVIDDMYDELRSICFDLMPQTLIKNGLESALQEFVLRVNQSGKIRLEFNVFGLGERLTDLLEISLFRIIQEWINNILKYSDAKKVTIQITLDDQEITLMIEDDGEGFEKALLTSGKGNGWKNLNTRANLLKGELELDTTSGSKGNALIFNAPLKLSENDEEKTKNTVETV